MGWLVFWTVLAFICIWGAINAFVDSFEESVCVPIYEGLSKQGRKTIGWFFLISLAFNIPFKALSRSAIWVALYAVITFAGYSPMIAYKFIAAFLFAAALQHTADLIKEYYPEPDKPRTHFDRWVKRNIPEKYR